MCLLGIELWTFGRAVTEPSLQLLAQGFIKTLFPIQCHSQTISSVVNIDLCDFYLNSILKAGPSGTHLYLAFGRQRGREISEFEVCLVLVLSSRTAGAT